MTRPGSARGRSILDRATADVSTPRCVVAVPRWYQNAGMASRSDLERRATLADEGTVGPVGESAHAFGSLSGEERLRLGRLAGVLMIIGAMVAFPAGLVLEPPPALHEHLLGLGSILAGVAV